MTATHLMTIDEFAEISKPGRFDLIRGELIEMAPAGFRHGVYASRIATAMSNFAGAEKLGEVPVAETGYVLNIEPPVVVCPDASFVLAGNLPPELPEGFLERAPDIAVEVVSPSDRVADVTAKVAEYLEAGTALVWVVEPRRRTVTVYHADRSARLLIDGDVLDGEAVLPGFILPLADIFR
ncbi:Uma2 family endonuclease [soil metagenome]